MKREDWDDIMEYRLRQPKPNNDDIRIKDKFVIYKRIGDTIKILEQVAYEQKYDLKNHKWVDIKFVFYDNSLSGFWD